MDERDAANTLIEFDPCSPALTCVISSRANESRRAAARRNYFGLLPSPFFLAADGSRATHWEGDTLIVRADDSHACLAGKLFELYRYLLQVSRFEYLVLIPDDGVPVLGRFYSFLFSLFSGPERPDYIVPRIAEFNSDPTCIGSDKREPLTFNFLDSRANADVWKDKSGSALSRTLIKTIVESCESSFLHSIAADPYHLTAAIVSSFGHSTMEIGDDLCLPADDPMQVAAVHILANGALSTAGGFPKASSTMCGDAHFLCSHRAKFLFLSIPDALTIKLAQSIRLHEAVSDPARDRSCSARVHSDDSLHLNSAPDREEFQRLLRRGYLRFAIYRDPFAKFMTLLSTMVSDTAKDGGRLQEPSLIVDEALDLVEYAFASQPMEAVDPSFRPQAYWISRVPLDFVVPFEHASAFLLEHFNLHYSSQTALETSDTLTPEQRRRIIMLYKDDFSIRCNWPA